MKSPLALALVVVGGALIIGGASIFFSGRSLPFARVAELYPAAPTTS